MPSTPEMPSTPLPQLRFTLTDIVTLLPINRLPNPYFAERDQRVRARCFQNARISVFAIRSTLRRTGYKYYVALRKPPVNEKNRQLRFIFALENVNWTDD
ncbi:uncharacterized protein BP5553_08402 [Venustampulla echinocandica]|uniref:Transposase Tc1-like domain-containing protein n=1 Tax=Venustampulla echinocandica TaxID=2656787 RepID=A0A370TE51_9HELO|nr:uncharacterized protein BP5553_08402 [Venustampulla echinocandica]RDL32963.1 hypothetical protein BP5553_08402 [Venustampulla echinocandica]